MQNIMYIVGKSPRKCKVLLEPFQHAIKLVVIPRKCLLPLESLEDALTFGYAWLGDNPRDVWHSARRSPNPKMFLLSVRGS